MKSLMATAISLALLCAGCAEWIPTPEQSGIDRRWEDDAVRPQDDLYRHVSGKWLETAVIPPDKARYGAFDQIRDQTEARLRSIIEGLAIQRDIPEGSNAFKMASLYRDFMDEAALESRGISPLTPLLAQIDQVTDRNALFAVLSQFAALDIGVPLEITVAPDARATTRYAVYVSQGGLGMPDRDYYLNQEDQRLRSIREAYLQYLERLFTLSQTDSPQACAKRVLAMETRLAEGQWSKVENRDAIKTYNRFAISNLATMLSDDVGWAAWLNGLDILQRTDALIVRQPSYLRAFGHLSRELPLEDWKLYLRARVLDAYAPYLGHAYVVAQFKFHGTTVRGIPENRPRWKRAVAVVESSMGEALGQRYVAEFFPESSKQRMQTLVSHLKLAYRHSIETLPWMGTATRQEALRKLEALGTKIGYPDRWRDYSALEIRPGDLLGNLMRASRFETRRQLAKLGKPIDRNEWSMTPQTVNAYYSARFNEIVFPAAILQPPFFDAKADDAVNYGGIGAVIGHEISHAFDDQGSQSDAEGNLRDWWSEEDRARFRERTQALVRQYDAYTPVPGYHVNGALTLGENIADNSGLAIAYKAYHLALGGQEAPEIDGLGGDQRFYSGWAQIWRSQVRVEELIRLLKVDPHAPAAVRANGALVNQPGFQSAYGTRPGDGLYRSPEEQVILW